MKYSIKHWFFAILLSSIFTSTFAANNVTLTVNYSTIGTNIGYDHLTKMIIFVDDEKVGESTAKNQTIPNSVSVSVPSGSHEIKAALYAKQDGIWEARTTDNNYSFNCYINETINFNSDKTIVLVFDFNKNEVRKENKSNNTLKANDLDKYKSNIDIMSSNTTTSKNSSSGDYQTELKKVNDFLKTFDNGYYGYLEIKDGYLYDRFKSGEHSKTWVKDLGNAVQDEPKRKVVVKCKSGNQCVFSTYTNSNHEQMSFSQSTDFNTQILIDLLNNLITAYNSNSDNANTSSYSSTKTEAQKIREQKEKESIAKSRANKN